MPHHTGHIPIAQNNHIPLELCLHLDIIYANQSQIPAPKNRRRNRRCLFRSLDIYRNQIAIIRVTALGLLPPNAARLGPQRRVDQRHRLLSLIFKNTFQNRSRKRRRRVFLNHTLIAINHPVQMPAHKLRVQRPHLFCQRQIGTDRIEIFRINRRQIDTTLNGLILQCIAQIHGNLPRHIFLRLKCRSPQMRRRNHLGPSNQRMISRRRLFAKHI